MSQDLIISEGSFVISHLLPNTEFENNKAILSYYFSDFLYEEQFGYPEIERFLEKANDPDVDHEVSLSINIDYDKIPDGFLEVHAYGGKRQDDGCFHLKESERESVEKMIAGLEASLKTLKEVKFHPNSD